MENAKQPVFLVVDGHPIHKATLVKDYVVGPAKRWKPHGPWTCGVWWGIEIRRDLLE